MAKKMVFIPPWGPYMESEDVPPTGSAAPNFVGKPPSDIYKEEGDETIRGEGTPQVLGYNPAAYAPTDYRKRATQKQADEMGPQLPSFGGGGNTGMGGGSSWTGGGGGGGGAMSTGSILSFHSDRTALDQGVWNRGVRDTAGASQAAQTYGAQAAGYASQLAGVNPTVGAMPRTLYDQYSTMLTDPNAFMNNPIVQAALQKAQQAAGRQLAAQRIGKSGNAAAAIAEQTGQTLMGQYYNMAGTLGQGAQLEASRWGTETGMNLDAVKARIAALQGAGGLATGAGELAVRGGNIAQQQAQLELQRVQNAILTPEQAGGNLLRAQAIQQASAGAGAYGGGQAQVSRDIQNQYKSLTGYDLNLVFQPGSTPVWGGGGYGFGGYDPRPGWYR